MSRAVPVTTRLRFPNSAALHFRPRCFRGGDSGFSGTFGFDTDDAFIYVWSVAVVGPYGFVGHGQAGEMPCKQGHLEGRPLTVSRSNRSFGDEPLKVSVFFFQDADYNGIYARSLCVNVDYSDLAIEVRDYQLASVHPRRTFVHAQEYSPRSRRRAGRSR